MSVQERHQLGSADESGENQCKSSSSQKNDFSRLKGLVYLDHAGAGLYTERQMDAVFKDLTANAYGNPHTRNTVSSYTSDVLDQARNRVVEHFNTNLEEYDVIFTSGATAAAKIVADSFVFAPDKSANQGTFAFLLDNHTSIVGMREVVPDRGASIRCVQLQEAKNAFAAAKSGVKKGPKSEANNLFVYPAESNFSGDKYPLEWVQAAQDGGLGSGGMWYCFLDAACFVSTNPLDLNRYKPDFVCVSFYKMFGYPTGLGALLVHHRAAEVLRKRYFGGGTVSMSVTPIRKHALKEVLHDRFEDGTLPFLSIIALRHGFDALQTAGGMSSISEKTFQLAMYTFRKLRAFRHSTGVAVAEIYCQSGFTDIASQGGIVTFNLRRPNGDYVGFTEVEEIANLSGILLRTGCFCNTGVCQSYLKLTNEDLIKNFKAGHVCGDKICLINGRPTGAIRISYGYSSSQEDADRFLKMVQGSFVFSQDKRVDHIELEPNNECDGVYISRLFIYPVKSCSGQEVKKWRLCEKGLLFDRQWMVIGHNGVPLSLKREPRLSAVKVSVDLKTNLLCFKHQYFSSISIPIDMDETSLLKDTQLCTSKICGKRVQGYDCGDEIAAWLDSCLLRNGCRLLRQNPGKSKEGLQENGRKRQTESFVNDSQFTLISKASLNWLKIKLMNNEAQQDLLEDEQLLKRFRSNFIIDGNLDPFQEETWTRFSINNHSYKILRPCSRCQVIGVNEKYQEKEEEPLRTLASERGQLMPFGMNFKLIDQELSEDAALSVGDRLSIIEERLTQYQ